MMPRKSFGLRETRPQYRGKPDPSQMFYPVAGPLGGLEPRPVLVFDPPITFPLVRSNMVGGWRVQAPLQFVKHMPSRSGRGGE